MIHILIMPSWYPECIDDISGVFFREQAVALHNCGNKVGVIYPKLLTLRSWNNGRDGIAGFKEDLDEGVITFRYIGLGYFSRLKKFSRWLLGWHYRRLTKQYIKRHGKPDIIHVQSVITAGFTARLIAKSLDIPYILTEHSTQFARGSISPSELKKFRDVVKCAKKRYAVSKPFCGLLASIFGSESGEWEELPNIVERKFTEYNTSSNGAAGKPFSFINVALLTPKKGVDVLIKAFAKSFKDIDGVVLRIGGDGSQRSQLELLAKKLEVSNKVIFLGKLSRGSVLQSLVDSDVFVLASHHETFGVVLIESLALGKPVIATKCGGPESIVRPEDGLLVPVDDVTSLANAMVKLYNNYNKYNAKEIRSSCVNRYGEKALINRLVVGYMDVLGSKHKNFNI